MGPLVCFIKENSWLARIAARQLKSRQVALVVGRTIYLHGVSATSFMQNTPWVRHEVCHVQQYQRYGIPVFLFLYALECVRKGYYNNRFEQAARAAEEDLMLLHTAIEFRPIIRS